MGTALRHCAMQPDFAWERADVMIFQSKLTSSGGRALQGCTELGTQKVGIYVYHIHPYGGAVVA
jgi:hypothetical protein